MDAYRWCRGQCFQRHGALLFSKARSPERLKMQHSLWCVLAAMTHAILSHLDDTVTFMAALKASVKGQEDRLYPHFGVFPWTHALPP